MSQRVDVEPLFAAEAKKRQGWKNADLSALMREGRKAADDAAKLVGVSPRYVQDAKRIQKEASAKAVEIRAGLYVGLSAPIARGDTAVKPAAPS